MNPNQNSDIKIIPTSETFPIIKKAIDKMVDFIKPTYGPASNKVIVSKLMNKMVIDDGVQIARDFELEDPVENAVVQVVREVAIKTNDRVGDGTTGALIMSQAIIDQVSHKTIRDGRALELELKAGLEEAKEQLRDAAREIKTKDELKKVALVSFDDEHIATMISDLYWKLGKDAIITVDKSPTLETTAETSDGITIDRGYISQYMILNPERMETVLEKPTILVTDYRLTEANDIIPIMNKMVAANKRDLVIICENMEQAALATAIVNKLQSKFFVLAITAPSDGDRKVALEDIALMIGAKMFTESKGDKLENAELKDLGSATRIIVRRDDSVIIGPKGKKADIQSAIAALRTSIAAEKDERQKKAIERRLGRYTNTIAVIKVGAMTESEQKALKYKVEDAVHAVKGAYNKGVVTGAGIALARLKTASPILNEALQYPSRQLRKNMGLDGEADLREGHTLNMVTGESGPYMKVGVVDPVEVLIAGVESAVSIASILLTSTGMIVESARKSKVE